MTLEKAIYNICGQYPSEEELDEIKQIATENILPRPVVRDGNGKLIKDHTPKDFFLKLQEEIFEAIDAVNVKDIFDEDLSSDIFPNDHIAEEIADIITVCISQLEAMGFDEKKRSELFAQVNEKNKKRGYFEESIYTAEEKILQDKLCGIKF